MEENPYLCIKTKSIIIMARVYSTVVSDWSGSVGGMIFYMRGKRQCVRSMPSRYRDANTAVQRRNRNRFALVSKTLAPLKEVLRIGFRYGFEGETAWNAAARANTRAAFVLDGRSGEYVLRPERLVVTSGRVARASSPVMLTDGNRIVVSWGSLAGRRNSCMRLDDRPMVTVYNADRGEVWHEVCGSRRDALVCETRVPSEWVGERMWVYLSFLTNSEVPRVSVSQYVGGVNEEGRIGLLRAEDREKAADEGERGTELGAGRSMSAQYQSPLKGVSRPMAGKGKKVVERGADPPC